VLAAQALTIDHASGGRLWVRVSAQVYNDRSDIETLADAVERRISVVERARRMFAK